MTTCCSLLTSVTVFLISLSARDYSPLTVKKDTIDKTNTCDPVELTQHILDNDQITDRAWITGY